MLALDATTRAEYDAEATAADAAQAVVDALGATVYVKVYDGAGTVKASGTMGSPWATQAAGVITIGEVSSFSITAAGAVDQTWYLRFEGGSRWVHGSFGLRGSGADFELSSDAWINGYTIRLGTVVLNAPTETAPSISGAPDALTFTVGVGGTHDFSDYASDAEGGALTYLLPGTSYTGISINASTGVLTVTSLATAGARAITVRVTDPSGLSSEHGVTVTLQSTVGTIKWHPGHYALPGMGDSDAARLTIWDDIDSSGGWQGGHVRYYWGDLETTLGNYNFAKILSDRNRLASHGLKIVIQIQIARFGTGYTTLGPLAPSYLAGSEYGGGAAYLADRAVLRVWDAAVVGRLLALDEALAEQFDGDAVVSGFVLAETALGAVTSEPGYSHTNFHTQLKRRILAGETSWPNTPRFLFFNWLLGTDAQKADMGAYCAAHGCGLGGPDIKPPDLFDGMEVYIGAIGGVDYRGVVPACYSNQADSVNGWSMSDLYNFALSPLQTNYMNTFVRPDGSPNTWASIRSFVASNPTMVSTLPTVYS